jgi:hypothetical protein
VPATVAQPVGHFGLAGRQTTRATLRRTSHTKRLPNTTSTVTIPTPAQSATSRVPRTAGTIAPPIKHGPVRSHADKPRQDGIQPGTSRAAPATRRLDPSQAGENAGFGRVIHHSGRSGRCRSRGHRFAAIRRIVK